MTIWRFWGDTLDKIAAEKAGIIKEGTVVVNYPDQPAEAMGPILTAAAEAHTSIITPDKDDLTMLRGKRLENRIDYGGYRVALGLARHPPGQPRCYGGGDCAGSLAGVRV